jgi:hypothetical protein
MDPLKKDRYMLAATLTTFMIATGLVQSTLPVKNVTAEEIAYCMKKSHKPSWGDVKRYPEYARLFIKNGKRWGINSVVIAGLAYTESRYHEVAPKLMRKVCKNSMVGCPDRPGPCYWRSGEKRFKETCKMKWINHAETGMLQVLWYSGAAKRGYRHCTGMELKGNRKQKKALLNPARVGICVGAYEMSIYKKWYTRRANSKHRWTRLRMRPRSKHNKAFFATYPHVLKWFWTSFYNWGSGSWPLKPPHNGYPRVVLSQAMKYWKMIRQRRATAGR